MRAFWVRFENGGGVSAACAYAEDEAAARTLAAKVQPERVVKSVDVLPYPARPRLDDLEGWDNGKHPSFCYDPNRCSGKSSCPKSYACSE